MQCYGLLIQREVVSSQTEKKVHSASESQGENSCELKDDSQNGCSDGNNRNAVPLLKIIDIPYQACKVKKKSKTMF